MFVEDDQNAFNVRDLCTCITREIAMRLAVYPNRVAAGKMTIEKAMNEVAMMKAILKIIQKLDEVTFISTPAPRSRGRLQGVPRESRNHCHAPMKEIKQILQEKVAATCRYEAKRNYLSMSKIAECSRKIALEFVNGTKPDYNTKARCWLGYNFEDIVAQWLIEEKILLPESRGKEISVFGGKFKGHIDGHSNQMKLIEIKSVSTDKFERILRDIKVPTKNFFQTQTYMYNGGFKEAMIIYVCRETMEFEVRSFNRVDKIGQRMNEKALRILDALNNMKIPVCDCGYCQK